MACPGVGVTAAGWGFFGGAVSGGGGLAAKAAGVVGATGVTSVASLGSATGAVAAVAGSVGGANPLAAATATISSTMGGLPGTSSIAAAIAGAAPSNLASGLTDPTNFVSSMVSHAQTLLPPDISSGIQIFDQVQAFSNASLDMMPDLTRALNTAFGDASELLADVTDFTGGGFLGEALGNFNEVITNGIGSLTDGIGGSITDLGSSFADFGKFGDLADVGNLMQPGQIASQLLANDLGDIGGFANNLLEAGVPLDDLTNPIYQNKIQSVMNGVTNVQDLADIKQVMGANVNLASLGDVTNFQKMLGGATGKSFSDFSDMATKFDLLEVGSLENVGQLGEMMGDMVDASDLSNVLTQTDFLSQANFDAISGIYGNGTGPDGAVLIRDVLGSSAGYGHEVYFDRYKQSMDLLEADGVTDTITSMYSEVSAGINGDYLDVPGDFGGSVEMTDPRSGGVFDTMDGFLQEKIEQIQAEYVNIAENTTASQLDLLNTAGNNWVASAEQVQREISNVAASELDVSLVSPGNKGSILSFTQQLNQYGADYRNKGEYLAKIAEGNLTGDFLKLALREGQNRALYDENNISYVAALADEEETILPLDTEVA